MSRIPYPSMDDLSEVKRRRIFDPARKYILNVSKMALHMPDALWDAQAELGRRATYECEMDPRLREIVVVRIGWLQKSEYELFHHKTIALNAGVSEAELAALQSEDLSIFSPEERALIAYTSEVTMNVSPSDETLAAARAAWLARTGEPAGGPEFDPLRRSFIRKSLGESEPGTLLELAGRIRDPDQRLHALVGIVPKLPDPEAWLRENFSPQEAAQFRQILERPYLTP